MPYRSLAQERFFHSGGAKEAGLTEAQVAEYDTASKGLNLPERIKKKSPAAPKKGRAKKKIVPKSYSLHLPKQPAVRKVKSTKNAR